MCARNKKVKEYIFLCNEQKPSHYCDDIVASVKKILT